MARRLHFWSALAMDTRQVTDEVRRRPSRYSRLGSLALLLGLVGCADIGGCDACNGVYAYPQSTLQNGVDPVANGARARMTQDALDFLEDNLKDILIGALGAQTGDPDTIAISLDTPFEVVSGVTIGEGPNETYPTTILIDAADFGEKLTMQFVAEGEQVMIGDNTVTVAQDGILIDAIDVPVGLDARLFTEVNLGVTTATAGCDIDGTNPDYCPGGSECGILTGLTLGILVYPEIQTGSGCDVPGTECLRINVDVVQVKLGSVGTDSLDISVPPRCNVSNPPADCSEECSDIVPVIDSDGDAECGIICAIEEFGIDLVVGIAGFIEPLIEGFLDELLESVIQDALADFDGAPAQVAGRVTPADLVPGIVSPSSLDLGFAITPTQDAFDVNCPGPGCPATKGMDFALKSGMEAAPDPEMATGIPHPCVNPLLGQDFINFYCCSQFSSTSSAPLTGELDGETYHLGASMAKGAVNQAMFAAYNAGTLCLEISSDSVHQLSGGAFPLSAGTLDLLTEGRLRQLAAPTAPAIITLTPHEPPEITLEDGSEENGHLLLAWGEVEVGFYVLTFERFARVFSVAADISVRMGVFNDPETASLRIAIIGGPEVGNFDERYNEMLPEVAFSEVLESLVGLAFDALLSDGLEFNYDVSTLLSDSLGAPIYVDFMGLQTLPVTGDRQFLNMYLKLTDMPPMDMRSRALGRFHVADEPGLLRFVEHEAMPSVQVPRATGEVHVVADGVPSGWQAFATVDFGMPRGPLTVGEGGVVVVRDPKLTLLGEHQVQLRVRPPEDRASLSPTQTVTVRVDAHRPKVVLERVGDLLVASANDLGSPTAALLYSWQLDDEAWSVFTPLASRPAGLKARRVSVRVMDEAGNVSFPSTVSLD